MKRNVLLIGGHGGRSGVPVYLRHLSALVFGGDVYVVSDVNRGGFDFASDCLGYYQIRGLASGSGNLFKVFAFLRLWFLIYRLEIDFVWANSSVSVLFVRLIYLLSGRRFRLIVTYHGVPFGRGRKKFLSFVLQATEYLVTRLLKDEKVVLLSKKDVEAFARINHPSKEVLVIGNPIDIACNHYKNNHNSGLFRLVMTSRFSRQKNIKYAFEISREIRNCELHIYGNMDELDCEIPSNVFLHGEHPFPPEILHEFDCYLMTSLYEGFPLGALEARGVGLCLATTDVGGADELVNDCPHAVLIPERDAFGAAGRICKLVEDYRSDEFAFERVRSSCMEYSVSNWVAKSLEVANE